MAACLCLCWCPCLQRKCIKRVDITMHVCLCALCACRLFARWMDFWWGYDVVHNYLLTGRFSWYVPSLTHISGEEGEGGELLLLLLLPVTQ